MRRAWALSLLLGACGPPQRPPADDDAGARPVDAQVDASVEVRDAPIAPMTTPYARPDFTVELPYGGAPRVIDVDATARAGRVDVHLLIDTTGSFDGEIDELQSELTRTLIPGLRRRIPSLTIGVSRFEDMPFEPWGAPTDVPFRLAIPQSVAWSQVEAAVARLDQPIGMGGDRAEAWAEALYQVATGEGLRVGTRVLVAPFRPAGGASGMLGGVGFRANSARVVVLVTDAPTHEPADYGRVVAGAHSSGQAIEALRGLGVRVVGVASAPDVRSGLESVALATGALASPVGGRCRTGLDGAPRAPIAGRCPLVYDLAPDGTGLSETIDEGIATLLDAAVYHEAHGEVENDEGRFVTGIEALGARSASGSPAPGLEDRRPIGATDGLLDTFTDVHAGTGLTFRLHLRNASVREGDFPQVFFLRLVITGDAEILREVLVRVIVPEAPKFDAGLVDGAQDAASDIASQGNDVDGALDDARASEAD